MFKKRLESSWLFRSNIMWGAPGYGRVDSEAGGHSDEAYLEPFLTIEFGLRAAFGSETKVWGFFSMLIFWHLDSMSFSLGHFLGLHLGDLPCHLRYMLCASCIVSVS